MTIFIFWQRKRGCVTAIQTHIFHFVFVSVFNKFSCLTKFCLVKKKNQSATQLFTPIVFFIFLSSGKKFDLTKVLVPVEVKVVQPSAVGIPLKFNLQSVLFLRVNTTIKAEVHPKFFIPLPDHVTVNGTMNIRFVCECKTLWYVEQHMLWLDLGLRFLIIILNVEPTARNFQLMLSLDSDSEHFFPNRKRYYFWSDLCVAVCCVLLKMLSVLSVLLLFVCLFICFSCVFRKFVFRVVFKISSLKILLQISPRIPDQSHSSQQPSKSHLCCFLL